MTQARKNMTDNSICWFAARMHCGSELSVRERLSKLGTENFLPTEERTRTRGHSKYEHPIIPGMIFVRTTKKRACELPNNMGMPLRYLIDPATRTLLVVPDKQMDDFRRVLDLSISEGGLMDAPLHLGDRVRVVKGPLNGVEGNIVEFCGHTYVVVGLMGNWFARAKVPRAWLELANGRKN